VRGDHRQGRQADAARGRRRPELPDHLNSPQQASPLLSLLTPDVRDDPFPVYRSLHENQPIVDTGQNVWMLSRYEDCHAALRDGRLSVEARTSSTYEEFLELSGRAGSPLQELIEELMLFRDPPDHTRLRGLVQKAFSPRRIEEMRPRVETVAGRLLDDLAPRGEMELMADFAYPLPIVVIAEMLGVPARDQDRFKGWAGDLALTLEPVIPPDVRERAEGALDAFRAYFEPLFEERRRDGGDDLLTALVEAEDEGDRLSEEELISNVLLLLIAGHETTQNLIGNGLYALLRNPDQLALVRDRAGDGEFVRGAVEELLRYDGSVQLTARIAREDVEYGGHQIPKGGRLLLLLGAANRDPERFEDPDRLDVTRADRGHLSFSGGPHYCLGNALARLEGEIALRTLLERLPDIELAGDEPPHYRNTVTLRGLEALPVRFTPA
jgi:pimeloyl-[acyl-carrier protein] synthase